MVLGGGSDVAKEVPPILTVGGFKGGGAVSVNGGGCGMFCGIP